MTIDQLFRGISDIEFQYKRFIKTKEFDDESLIRFDIISAEICQQIISMSLSEIITTEAERMGRIDINFTPTFGLGKRIINALTFGYSIKQYKKENDLPIFMRQSMRVIAYFNWLNYT